jgi:hypothetical protein
MIPVDALTSCLLTINIDTALKAAHVALLQSPYFSSVTCECPTRYMQDFPSVSKHDAMNSYGDLEVLRNKNLTSALAAQSG